MAMKRLEGQPPGSPRTGSGRQSAASSPGRRTAGLPVHGLGGCPAPPCCSSQTPSPALPVSCRLGRYVPIFAESSIPKLLAIQSA